MPSPILVKFGLGAAPPQAYIQIAPGKNFAARLSRQSELDAVCVLLANALVFVSFAFVVLDLVSSVLYQKIGWEERLLNDLFSIEWGVKA